MPELKKIEASAAYTPSSGEVVEYLAEEDGKLVIKVKKSDGTEQTLSGGGGGGSMDFYKCAHVYTAVKSWTGYKAVLGEDGVYTFEETVTEGLTYGNGFTPAVGGIYSADALVTISLLWTGVDPTLVFWTTLAFDTTTAETGQTMTKNGNVTFSDGKAVFGGSDYIEVTDTTGFPLGGSPFTLHAKVTFTNTVYDFNHILSFGNHVGIRAYDNNLLAFTSSGDIRKYDIQTNTEYISDITYDGAVLKLYVDGVLAEEKNISLNIGSASLTIGRGNGSNGSGSVRDVKLFTRALSAEEIAELVNA